MLLQISIILGQTQFSVDRADLSYVTSLNRSMDEVISDNNVTRDSFPIHRSEIGEASVDAHIFLEIREIGRSLARRPYPMDARCRMITCFRPPGTWLGINNRWPFETEFGGRWLHVRLV